MYISKQATKSWTPFVFKGKKFLALEASAFGNHVSTYNQVTIIGEDLSNYGPYRSIENFKKYYEEKGEDYMNLGELT